MENYGVVILPSLLMGLLARLYMIRIDHRQYPSYPQGLLSHLTLGVIAAGLGSVALPALLSKEYSAVTFLALAAQQFRDVRSMERQSLDNIEPTELVPRGTAYIEDIAKAFEARNYMVIITALMTSIAIYFAHWMKQPRFVQILVGIVAGLFIMILLKGMLKRQSISEIAEVKVGKLYFEGPLLMVNGIVIMNIGLKSTRKIYEEKGVAVEIVPKNVDAKATLANTGQRQAIQHNVAVHLGIQKDVDEPEFTPIARRNAQDGTIIMVIVPTEVNRELLIAAVAGTPVLETAKRKPFKTKGTQISRS
jgi:hypothetical protein